MPTNNPPHDLSPAQLAELQKRALAVAHNAYAPYSHFRVGAALLLASANESDTDVIVTGCNVENASFRLTTCAEQSAIAAAVSLHGPTIRIRAIVVTNLNNLACQPCGACRQTIFEFSTHDTRIFFPSDDGTTSEATITNLLPAAFFLKN